MLTRTISRPIVKHRLVPSSGGRESPTAERSIMRATAHQSRRSHRNSPSTSRSPDQADQGKSRGTNTLSVRPTAQRAQQQWQIANTNARDTAMTIVPRFGDPVSRLPLHQLSPSAKRPLPHLRTIERSFGSEHELSSVRAEVGGSALIRNTFLGASASTQGEQVAFSRQPSLGEAAHEAAHVVQQRQGVGPSGGLSRAGDIWEHKADAVAVRVARGEAVADLLGPPAPPVPRRGRACPAAAYRPQQPG